MADTGSEDDIVARQAAVLPPWFGPPGTAPAVLGLPLAMAANAMSWLWSLVDYARKQSRISTATGGWLELIAWDFFGSRVRRKPHQEDDAFRRTIKIEMFRPRNTRAAMVSVIKDLVGQEPRIFEPGRPADTGGIGVPSGLAIGVSGAIGSIDLPGSAFLDVYRTPQAGIIGAAGIGIGVGGIGRPSRLVMASLAEIRGTLTDEDIRLAVEATRPEGIVVWMRILQRKPS